MYLNKVHLLSANHLYRVPKRLNKKFPVIGLIIEEITLQQYQDSALLQITYRLEKKQITTNIASINR